MSDGRGSGNRPAGAPGGGQPAGSGAGRGPGGHGGGMGHGPMGGFGAPAQKAKNFKGSLKRLLGYLKPRMASLVSVFVLAIASTLFAVFAPKIMGQATTKIFEGLMGMMKHQAGAGIDFGTIGQIVVILIGLYAVSAIFSYLQQFIMAGVAQKTAYDMRRDVSNKLARLPLKFFDGRTHGEIMSRVTNDLDNVANTLQQSLTQLITSVLTVIGVLVMMVLISPELAVISLLAVPASVIVAALIAKRSQKQFAAQWKITGALNGHVEEMHTGHAIVTVFGRQEEALATFQEQNEKLYDASYRAQFISGIIQPAMSFIANLNYVGVAVIGGLRVASGQLTLGDVQAFVQYSRQFTQPIIQTASILNVIQSAVASAERAFELLDETEEIPDVAEPQRVEHAAGQVVFDDVSFRYLPDVPLIDDMNLVVQPGHTIAIVGPTGAGKTTLVNLLMRFYEIDGGRITVDGVDTREMTRDDLRHTFGMVLQDAWLFHGTIRENIAYGLEGATEEQIVAAAEAAHVDHFVRTLAEGYDTVIDDDATNLSQGEKQLLTIARAFLADPQILILDEATSSVDTRTEVLIQRAMAKLMEGRTSFVIAHRLSTIRDAHTILVMNHGKIVEQGDHESLLAQRGFYYELYSSQFTAPVAEAA